IAHAMCARGDYDRYAQAMAVTVPAGADRDGLVATLQSVVDHHDALRARIDGDRLGSQPAGVAEVAGMVERRSVAAAVLADPERFTPVAEAAVAAAADRLDPRAGRLVQLVWFEPEGGGERDAAGADAVDDGGPAAGRLLIVIHHLAVDGVSWRILLPDFAAAWAAHVAGAVPELPAAVTSARRWAYGLTEAAASCRGELEFWRSTLDEPDPEIGSE